MSFLDKIGDKIDSFARTRTMRDWERFRLGEEKRRTLFELYNRRRSELNGRYCDAGGMEWIRSSRSARHFVDDFIDYYMRHGNAGPYMFFKVSQPRESFVILPTVFRTKGREVALIVRFGLGDLIEVEFDREKKEFRKWTEVIEYLDAKV